MPEPTREQLNAYLDDALSEVETAQVEKALRESATLQRVLRGLMQQRDRGEHSLGAVWRRQRLTCPSREQLGSFLLEVLDPEVQDYVTFHLHTVGCPYCLANWADLMLRQQGAEPEPRARERRQRIFESSAGLLTVCRDGKK